MSARPSQFCPGRPRVFGVSQRERGLADSTGTSRRSRPASGSNRPVMAALPWIVVLLLFCPTKRTVGQDPRDPEKTLPSFSPIQVRFICDQDSIQPGQPFSVGLLQDIQPGFHTYWRNPGTVGLPTHVDWDLPEGFTASPMIWPTPQRSQMAEYEIWGYRDQALLLTTITPPNDLPSGDAITIRGKASWMCCGRQCHPGFLTIQQRLRVEDDSGKPTRWARAFERVRSQQPMAFSHWTVEGKRRGDRYLLEITPRHPSDLTQNRTIHFFGYKRQVSSAAFQALTVESNRYILTLQHEPFSGEDHETLPGILVSNEPWDRAEPERPLLINPHLTSLPPR